jgi:hypothetical protein
MAQPLDIPLTDLGPNQICASVQTLIHRPGEELVLIGCPATCLWPSRSHSTWANSPDSAWFAPDAPASALGELTPTPHRALRTCSPVMRRALQASVRRIRATPLRPEGKLGPSAMTLTTNSAPLYNFVDDRRADPALSQSRIQLVPTPGSRPAQNTSTADSVHCENRDREGAVPAPKGRIIPSCRPPPRALCARLWPWI